VKPEWAVEEKRLTTKTTKKSGKAN